MYGHYGFAWHEICGLQDRQRRMQATEVVEILEHRLHHGVGEFGWLPSRRNEQGAGAECWDVIWVACIHAAGNDRGAVQMVEQAFASALILSSCNRPYALGAPGAPSVAGGAQNADGSGFDGQLRNLPRCVVPSRTPSSFPSEAKMCLRPRGAKKMFTLFKAPRSRDGPNQKVTSSGSFS